MHALRRYEKRSLRRIVHGSSWHKTKAPLAGPTTSVVREVDRRWRAQGQNGAFVPKRTSPCFANGCRIQKTNYARVHRSPVKRPRCPFHADRCFRVRCFVLSEWSTDHPRLFPRNSPHHRRRMNAIDWLGWPLPSWKPMRFRVSQLQSQSRANLPMSRLSALQIEKPVKH